MAYTPKAPETRAQGLAGVAATETSSFLPLCPAIAEPFCGLETRFYAIRRRWLDFGDLEARIDDDTVAVMSVNYFRLSTARPRRIASLTDSDCYHIAAQHHEDAAGDGRRSRHHDAGSCSRFPTGRIADPTRRSASGIPRRRSPAHPIASGLIDCSSSPRRSPEPSSRRVRRAPGRSSPTVLMAPEIGRSKARYTQKATMSKLSASIAGPTADPDAIRKRRRKLPNMAGGSSAETT